MKELILFILFPIIALANDYYLPTNNLIILEHNTYSIGYNTNTLQAAWVQYVLASNQLCSTNRFKRTDDFRPDPLLTNTNYFVVKPYHYNKVGYDKGHLCPAQDRAYSKEATSETFYMSNMSPQLPRFNRGSWKKLEEWTRQYAITNGSPVTVITGPVFMQYEIHDLHKHIELKDGNKICVPNQYFKILLTEKWMDKNICTTNKIMFIMKNE